MFPIRVGILIAASVIGATGMSFVTRAQGGEQSQVVSQATASQPAQAAEARTKERPGSRRADQPAPDSRDGEPAIAAECAWVGKRIVSLLVRDDAMAAGDFVPFYLRFKCPEDRIGKSFGCVVRNGEATPHEMLADRVEQCWANPEVRFPKLQRELAPEPPSAPPPAKPPAAGGN